MAEKTVEFFWDVGSPYTYLAATRIDKVAESCGASVRWRPFLLGGVFRETGNRPPIDCQAKGNYMLEDLKTWAAYYGVPFGFPAFFPVNSLGPMRAAVWADRQEKGAAFGRAILRVFWADGKDPSDPEILASTAASVGLDGEALLAATQDPDVKEGLKQSTQEAVDRGAFGAPTFFVGQKMFWGNDRLTLLEAYVRGDLPGGEA